MAYWITTEQFAVRRQDSPKIDGNGTRLYFCCGPTTTDESCISENMHKSCLYLISYAIYAILVANIEWSGQRDESEKMVFFAENSLVRSIECFFAKKKDQ